MNQSPPLLTLRVAVPSTATPEAAYDVVSDLRTHLVWAGEQAPAKNFRLLSMDAPARAAEVGDRFSSTGAADATGWKTFHDRSTVITAERPRRFAFETEASLQRKHAKTWKARFTTGYEIEPTPTGSLVTHTSEVRPQNYLPYWLWPGMRQMTRWMMQRSMRRQIQNLARMAETAQVRTG